jgi:insulysin
MALGAKDASSGGGSSNTHEVEIKKSKLDKREYKYLTLPNKLRVILISNPMADKGSASLDVKVGVSLDQKPLYGTAHFLEHMLFMGTKKYPLENEYSSFM